jgi:hypothetical protein
VNLSHFEPEKIVTELAAKLSARTRHVCVFLGAGAPHSAGLPNLKGLQTAVTNSLSDARKKTVEQLFEAKDLEATLSYLRRLVAVLDGKQKLGEFTAESAGDLHTAITEAIIPALDHGLAKLEPFQRFATWVAGEYYRLPVEIFTINYDLLIETGLETLAVPYFDGFVGNIRARFRPELVDTVDPTTPGALPGTFVRVWKLHGSVNWTEEIQGNRRNIVRLGAPAPKGTVAAIYPSDEKYDQSRRVPFVVLMDRFRRALAIPETITLVSGYSFRDQHLNEMMFDAARAHPRSETVVFCFSTIPTHLADVAGSTRNISVFSAKDAIIGGRRLSWERDADIPGIWENKDFQLGDFAHLASFLATKARTTDAGA